MPEVAFIVPCRDKAPWIAETAHSILSQTYAPMDIVFSDQGSEDGTRAILEGVLEGYNGPNNAYIVDCPRADLKGMPGYNAHIDWLMSEIEADLFIQSSADDIAHPERAAKVVAAWKANGADYIGTKQFGYDHEGNMVNAPYADLQTAWVPIDVVAQDRFGGKTSSAWTRALYEKYPPLSGVECQDLILPLRACLENGFLFLGEELHRYIQWPDANNLGLEGRLRMAKSEAEELQWCELIHFQMTANIFSMLETLEARMQSGAELDEQQGKARHILANQSITQAQAWQATRQAMQRAGVQPLAFPS